MACICLLVLCGIPGAGKSTWARKFLSYIREMEHHASLHENEPDVLNETGLNNKRGGEGARERIGQGEVLETYRVIHVAYDDLIPEELEVELIRDAQNHSEERKGASWKTYRRAIVRCVDDLLAELCSLKRLPGHITCDSLTQIVTETKNEDAAEKQDTADSARLGSSCQQRQQDHQIMDDAMVAEVTNYLSQSQLTDDKSTSQNATSLSQNAMSLSQNATSLSPNATSLSQNAMSLSQNADYSSSIPHATASSDSEGPAVGPKDCVVEQENLKPNCYGDNASGLDSMETVTDFLKAIFDDVVRRQIDGRESSSAVRWILVIDDNMYYSSMRYEFYQLARKYATGFAQVYFPVELITALQRNQTRKRRVEESVISDMLNRLESPCVDISWEKYSATWTNENWDQSSFESILRLINKAMLNPVMPAIPEDEAGAEESRAICSASLLHQADVALRKILGAHIAGAKDVFNSKAERSRLAASCNLNRQQILDDLRNQSLSIPSGMALETSTDLETPFYSYLRFVFHQRLKAVSSNCENKC